VGRVFYAQKNKNIKNCVRPEKENMTPGVPSNRRFILCKLQKMKRRLLEESAETWHFTGNSCPGH
jgi:hypothetical protein